MYCRWKWICAEVIKICRKAKASKRSCPPSTLLSLGKVSRLSIHFHSEMQRRSCETLNCDGSVTEVIIISMLPLMPQHRRQLQNHYKRVIWHLLISSSCYIAEANYWVAVAWPLQDRVLSRFLIHPFSHPIINVNSNTASTKIGISFSKRSCVMFPI